MPYFGVKINISPVLFSGKHGTLAKFRGLFQNCLHKYIAFSRLFKNCSCITVNLLINKPVLPMSAKKCKIFSGIYALKFCEFRRFFSCQKPAFLFLVKNHRKLRFAACRSGMSHKSQRKLAKLRQRTFFYFYFIFFGDQHKIGGKDASVGAMTFFFLEITLKPDKKDKKIFGIFTLSLEQSHYFRHFRRR